MDESMGEPKDDNVQWPPPEEVDERAIVHIEEGAKGSSLLGSGGQGSEPDPADE